jgi:hypothetical protein
MNIGIFNGFWKNDHASRILILYVPSLCFVGNMPPGKPWSHGGVLESPFGSPGPGMVAMQKPAGTAFSIKAPGTHLAQWAGDICRFFALD